MKRYDEAISALHKTQVYDPKMAAAYSATAMAEARAGKLPSSKEQIEKAQNMGADDGLYFAALALINHLSGDEDKAKTALDKAQSKDANNWSVTDVTRDLK
jgi:Flp pilus assembly protein TadD